MFARQQLWVCQNEAWQPAKCVCWPTWVQRTKEENCVITSLILCFWSHLNNDNSYFQWIPCYLLYVLLTTGFCLKDLRNHFSYTLEFKFEHDLENSQISWKSTFYGNVPCQKMLMVVLFIKVHNIAESLQN